MTFMTMPFFATSGKYHGAVWTNSHVVMGSHIAPIIYVFIFSMFWSSVCLLFLPLLMVFIAFSTTLKFRGPLWLCVILLFLLT